VKEFKLLNHTSHKGRFKTYRLFLHHYLSKILKGHNSKDKVFFFLLNKEEQQKHFERVLNSYYTKKKHLEMNRNKNIPTQKNDDGMSSFIMNKIIGAYKTTKEHPYVKSMYQEKLPAFNNDTNQSNDNFNKLPENTTITLYPSYSKQENGEYYTRVKGVVTATSNTLSRKNKFLLSMARRITKSNDPSSTESLQFESEMHDAITYQDNYKSNGDDNSSISSNIVSQNDDTIKARMEGIMAKTIPGTPLNITIGSDIPVDQLLGANLTTDGFGIFQISIVTPYKPSYVAVSSIISPSILQTTTVEVLDFKGISVITDIDDTIRLTGVLGEKRELFRNIFSRPYLSCEVPGVSEWYQELYKDYNCAIHYVSNSPWQVFNIVYGFMNYMNFPITSIHLRQYSGNLVASFTQPGAERKRPSLLSLFEEFPDRKFILIGDTGEQDLEAYLSLIPQYATQILAIYLRVVPKSFSSLDNDAAAFKEIKKIVEKRNINGVSAKKINEFLRNPSGIDSDDSDDENLTNWRNSISQVYGSDIKFQHLRHRPSLDQASNPQKSTVNIYGVKKLAPIVPKKPAGLRGTKLPKLENNFFEVTETLQSNKNDISFSSSLNKDDLKTNDYVHINGESEVDEDIQNDILSPEITDKRFNLWKQKAHRIVNEIPEHIAFEFWEDPEPVRRDSIELIIKQIK
jgi:phosphatidate phosphatase APP1